MGFGMVIGFIDHLENSTTNNYYSLTALYISISYIKYQCNYSTHKAFSVSHVFESCCLVTDPNNVLWFRVQALGDCLTTY